MVPRHGATLPSGLPSGLLRATWPGHPGCGRMESRCMQPRITLITLGVDDVERAVRFYRDGLGLKLALWPRTSIAHETGLTLASPSPTEFTLGHNVASKGDVDVVMAQATRAGAVVVQPAHDTLWGGYAGSFQDSDGHLWEVAWNPQWVVEV